MINLSMDEIVKKPWWTVEDVQVYLGLRSLGSARRWMLKNRVRRSSTLPTRTCREWVDAAMLRSGARPPQKKPPQQQETVSAAD
jgi:hypothetical protein